MVSDPGFTRTGYAILEVVTKTHGLKSESILLKKCDIISPKKTDSLPKRLHTIFRALEALSVEHVITDIALETSFLGKNAQTFLKLGYIRGIIYLLAEIHGLRVHEYAPQFVKKAVTGYGTATKEDVLLVLQRMFPELKTPKYLDISDAIAVGICTIRMSK